MRQNSPACRRRRWLRALWRLLLVAALPPLIVMAPPGAHAAERELARPPALGSEDLAPYLGHYHPNTTIELRGDELWFVRPPYQSRLVAIGDGLFGFTSGWLEGVPLHFGRNDDGSTSILLLSPAGAWDEFARSGTPYPAFDPALAVALAHALDQVVANRSSPGVVLSVSLPGQGVWAGARGLSNRDRGIPMVPGDAFRIASISKMFVAVVALQLAQEGALSLDQSVAHWLPGLLPDGERITVRQLLNHTSGLANYLDDAFVSRALASPGRVWAPRELVGAASRRAPFFAPGAAGRWRYSNTNYVLLGMIVEQAGGSPLHHQIRARILDPLGMRRTAFEPAEAPAPVMRSYAGRRDLADANLSFAWAAGSMTSTVEDLDRFARALFGGALLGSDALALMHATVATNGALARPSLGYGLGVMHDVLDVGRAADGRPRPAGLGVAYGHTGALLGSRTAMWHLPERGVTLVIALNTMGADPNKILAPILDAVLAHTGG